MSITAHTLISPASVTQAAPEAQVQARPDRRIRTDIPPAPRPARDDAMPGFLPVWAIRMRADYEATISRLERQVSELENAIMESRSAQQSAAKTALELYGESRDVKLLATRLNVILPNASDLGATGVALIAQIAIAHGLDPLPGSDHIYGWTRTNKKTGEKEIVVTIGYKGLLHLARKQVRFNYQSRPMTQEEREEHGLKTGEHGYITTLYEIENAIECRQAGIPYFPIVGIGIWRIGDEFAKGRSPAWNAKKNSLKDALRQIAVTGQRLADALDAAFMEAGKQLAGAQFNGDDLYVPVSVEMRENAIESGAIPADDPGPDTFEGEMTEPEQPPLFGLPSTCTQPGCTDPGDVTPLGFLCATHARQAADAEAAKN